MAQRIQHIPFFLGPEDTDKACLLIHGFSGAPTEMQGLGEALASRRIRSYGMLVAGHTGDPEDLLHSGRKQWIASAEESLAQLASYPHVFVVGLSMGGALALLLASRHAERITGVAALSSLTRLGGGWQVQVLPLMRHLVKWFYPLAGLNFSDPKVQEEMLKQARLRDADATIDFSDPQTITALKRMVRLPVSALAELFLLANEGRRHLDEVRSPLLIIHSKRDNTVAPACANELFRLTPLASPKTLHWLEQSDHVITTGVECEKVYRLIAEFINATVQGAAGTALQADAHRDEADGTHPGH